MSRDMIREKVPHLDRREGDAVLAGANNSTLILGRDRDGDVNSGYGNAAAAGSVHAVVGRKTKDLSFKDDAASIVLSQKNDPDTMAGTQSISPQSKAVSTVAGRADCIRLSARKDLKISVGSSFMVLRSDGTIVLDGDISLGENASDRIMKGDAFSLFWNTVRVPTPSGLSGPLPPIPDNIFSPRSKVR